VIDETRRPSQEETAVLVAVQLPSASDEQTEDSLSELAALATTAGASIVASSIQKRRNYDPATLLGKGKVEEVAREVTSSEADLVIFDNDLSVGQQSRLEELLGARVIDRTALILDIFAQHAHTAEGRTQVELAQYSYLLPRIRGLGIEMSRMAGGIGTRRGPGETKLEVDRRRIRRRMHTLERELSQMEAVRTTQRKRRSRAGLPAVSLVGYTNSGKSSLLNRLTGSTVPVQDQLFSTLDSTTRRLELPDGPAVVVSDTVGFIRKLPHELVAAFRSTLEVVRDADLLLHVVDAMRQETMEERIQAVREVLDDLGASDIPAVLVMNKIDAVEPGIAATLRDRYEGSILTSAVTGEGVGELLSLMSSRLSNTSEATLRIPASRGDVVARLYREATVLRRDMEEDTFVIVAAIPRDKTRTFARYMVRDGK
jgi:GTPase